MECPFCKGPVEDENCDNCGSLEGFTADDTRSVEQKPSKMIQMSSDWTDSYATQGTVFGAARDAGAETAANTAQPAFGAQETDDVDDDDQKEIFESSCVDNALKIVDINVNGHIYHISQVMEPDDLAPIFSDVWTGSQVWRCSVVSSQFMSDFYSGKVSLRPWTSGESKEACSVPQAASPSTIENINGEVKGNRSATSGSSAEKSRDTKVAVDGVDAEVLSKLRCIELGSGCGLLAIHAARLGMGQVVATDQTAMVRLARHNIKENLQAPTIRACAAEELFWGDADQAKNLLQAYGPFDVVWVSDCLNPIYGVDSYEKLARSVLHLAGPNTLCLIAYECRGNTDADVDPLQIFFTHLRARKMSIAFEDTESPITIYACLVGDATSGSGGAATDAPTKLESV